MIVVYANVSATLRTGIGPVVIAVGEPWDGDDPLVKAYPSAFSPGPQRVRSTVAPKGVIELATENPHASDFFGKPAFDAGTEADPTVGPVPGDGAIPGASRPEDGNPNVRIDAAATEETPDTPVSEHGQGDRVNKNPTRRSLNKSTEQRNDNEGDAPVERATAAPGERSTAQRSSKSKAGN